MNTTRQRIAAALDQGQPFHLGKTVFHRRTIDGKTILAASNWHGSASVLPSWVPEHADPSALALAVFRNRRHYRNPCPSYPGDRRRLVWGCTPLITKP